MKAERSTDKTPEVTEAIRHFTDGWNAACRTIANEFEKYGLIDEWLLSTIRQMQQEVEK